MLCGQQQNHLTLLCRKSLPLLCTAWLQRERRQKEKVDREMRRYRGGGKEKGTFYVHCSLLKTVLLLLYIWNTNKTNIWQHHLFSWTYPNNCWTDQHSYQLIFKHYSNLSFTNVSNRKEVLYSCPFFCSSLKLFHNTSREGTVIYLNNFKSR